SIFKIMKRMIKFFFSSRRQHTRFSRDWSSDVCSSDLYFRYIGIFGLAAAPLLATYLVQVNPQLVGRVSPVIARIFTPFVLIMLRSEERRVGKGGRSRVAAIQ